MPAGRLAAEVKVVDVKSSQVRRKPAPREESQLHQSADLEEEALLLLLCRGRHRKVPHLLSFRLFAALPLVAAVLFAGHLSSGGGLWPRAHRWGWV